MDKQAKTRFWILTSLLILMLAVAAYAYGVSLQATPSVTSGTWTTGTALYINFTPTIDDYDNFDVCGVAGGGNITDWFVNLSAEWPPGNNSEFGINRTLGFHFNQSLANGSTIQFNITDLPDSPVDGWEYYFTIDNLTSQNNCGINFSKNSATLTVKVDSTVPTFTLDRPLAGANFTNREVTFNATTVEHNPVQCQIYFNSSAGSDATLQDTFNYQNNSVYERTKNVGYDGTISYFIQCGDLAGNWANSSTRTFGVDSLKPTVTVNDPSNGSWRTATTSNFNITVLDHNIGQCSLLSNFTSSGSDWTSDTSAINQTSEAFGVPALVNDTSTDNIFNASLADDLSTDGGYKWAFRCNDTFGNEIQTQNFSVFVDTVTPSQFTMDLDNRTSSDHTPNFTINRTVDSNFGYYHLQIANDIAFSSIARSQNFSGDVNLSGLILSGSNKLNASQELDGVTRYYWRVYAYDIANNSRLAVNASLQYDTDEVCANLSQGYNYCGMVNEGLTSLGTIADDAKAQNTYYWKVNDTGAEWITHTRGTSTNRYYNLTRGDVAVLFINSTATPTLWETRTWAVPNNGTTYLSYNFTANNHSGYQLFTVMNYTTLVNFTRIEESFMRQEWNGTDDRFNESIKYLSKINNSALADSGNNLQFIPFFLLKNINEGTNIRFGETFWTFNINYTDMNVSGGSGIIPHMEWNRSLGLWG